MINYHTRDLKECSTAAEFVSIIKGVSVNGKHYWMEPAVGYLDIIWGPSASSNSKDGYHRHMDRVYANLLEDEKAFIPE